MGRPCDTGSFVYDAFGKPAINGNAAIDEFKQGCQSAVMRIAVYQEEVAHESEMVADPDECLSS